MTAPDLSAEERAVVERFEAAEAAPESFDATAALRRVLELADRLDFLRHNDEFSVHDLPDDSHYKSTALGRAIAYRRAAIYIRDAVAGQQ